MISIKKFRIRYDGIAADLFINRAWSNTDRPIAIVLSGFPDFAGSTALTTALIGAGVMVLQPHLAGTYDSDGEFSPEGCRETLRRTSHALSVKRLRVADGRNTIPVSPTRISLIGHSFGGIAALRYFNEIEHLDSLVFTSAALHYDRVKTDYGCYEDGPSHYRKVSLSHPYTYRLADAGIWQLILEGKDPLPNSPIGQIEAVKIIYGERDKYFDIAAIRKNVPELVSKYVNAKSLKTIVVPEAGHSISEITAMTSILELMPEVL